MIRPGVLQWQLLVWDYFSHRFHKGIWSRRISLWNQPWDWESNPRLRPVAAPGVISSTHVILKLAIYATRDWALIKRSICTGNYHTVFTTLFIKIRKLYYALLLWWDSDVKFEICCRGDIGFCSIVCRDRQIVMDEMRDLEGSTKKMLAAYRRRSCTSKVLEDVHLQHDRKPSRRTIFALWHTST